MSNPLTDAAKGLWDSTVRTAIPIIVTAVVNWLATVGIIAPEEWSQALINFLSVLAGVLFYVAVRLLEQAKPKLGWLLGSAKEPVYVDVKAGQSALIVTDTPNTEH